MKIAINKFSVLSHSKSVGIQILFNEVLILKKMKSPLQLNYPESA
jgi:hypothetical protein